MIKPWKASGHVHFSIKLLNTESVWNMLILVIPHHHGMVIAVIWKSAMN